MRRVENLAHLHDLQTLLLSGNQLVAPGDIEHVRQLPSLTCLDLSDNRLADVEGVLGVLEALPLGDEDPEALALGEPLSVGEGDVEAEPDADASTVGV